MDLSEHRRVIYTPRLKIRALESKDTDLLVDWRNQDYIREVSRQSKKITHSEHEKWFKGSRERRLDFVLCDITSDTPIGLISFERSEKSVMFDGYYEMSKYIGDKNYLGKGLAFEGCEALLSVLEQVESINGVYAVTKSNNRSNIGLNLKLGFVIDDPAVNTNLQKSNLILMKKVFHSR
jgi:RimJ/RimL family protein N-acetyltransferase